MEKVIRSALENGVGGSIGGVCAMPIDEKVAAAATQAAEALRGLTFSQAEQAIWALQSAIRTAAVVS